MARVFKGDEALKLADPAVVVADSAVVWTVGEAI